MGEVDQFNDDYYWDLTDEQRYNYGNYGCCDFCKQLKNNYNWCKCNFQRNFKNWNSGNDDVDKFIKKAQLKAKSECEVLEWIGYSRFEINSIEYLGEGGFGTVHKAIWKDGPIMEWNSVNNKWERRGKIFVALKYFHNSQNITAEYLKEIESQHMLVKDTTTIARLYGITKDPKTNNFMMVMEYAKYGSLRKYLNTSFNSLDWTGKLYNLHFIAFSLDRTHRKGLIHCNFHSGNILNYDEYGYIRSKLTDVGLCKPANITSQNVDRQTYGVLPYVAPEILRGKKYIQASDIYAFGIIAYEVCTGFPPFYDIAHDEVLAIKICQGLRPKSGYEVPQLVLDIIQRCWDTDPLNRPEAEELVKSFGNLWKKSDMNGSEYDKNSTIGKQIREANKINNGKLLSYTSHAQAVYTSRPLKFKNFLAPGFPNFARHVKPW